MLAVFLSLERFVFRLVLSGEVILKPPKKNCFTISLKVMLLSKLGALFFSLSSAVLQRCVVLLVTATLFSAGYLYRCAFANADLGDLRFAWVGLASEHLVNFGMRVIFVS